MKYYKLWDVWKSEGETGPIYGYGPTKPPDFYYKLGNSIINKINDKMWYTYNNSASATASTASNIYEIDYGITDATTTSNTYRSIIRYGTSNSTSACYCEEDRWDSWTWGSSDCEGRWQTGTVRLDPNTFEPYWSPRKTPAERLREIIQTRQSPGIIVRKPPDHYHFARQPLRVTQDVREMRARETLRRVLGEQKFRDYVKTGFVCVRAKSGLVYQIFPAHGVTAVYDNGKMVERLCVVLVGDFPPTDSLIMRYLLILNNEDEFRAKANTHRLFKQVAANPQPDQRSLVEIFNELKKVA